MTMTLPLTRYYSEGDLWLGKVLRVLKKIHFSKFCFFLTLRQGAILIGIIELSMTIFLLFLFLLGVAHAEDIIALASEDLHQLEENRGLERTLEESPLYFANNEKKMLLGQHLAFIIMVLVCTGLVIAVVHCISCILLIYGALKNSPNFLLPWTSTVFISVVLATFFLITFVFIPLQCKCKVLIFTVGLLALTLETYAWINVFNYYCELKT